MSGGLAGRRPNAQRMSGRCSPGHSPHILNAFVRHRKGAQRARRRALWRRGGSGKGILNWGGLPTAIGVQSMRPTCVGFFVANSMGVGFFVACVCVQTAPH